MSKRIVILIALLAFCMVDVQAQNMNCLGLKNPTNCTLTGGTGRTKWTGYTGRKVCTASSCTQGIALFYNSSAQMVTVQAAQLEAAATASCSGWNVPSGFSDTKNIRNQNDQTNRFSIKGRGTDPYTYGNLTYTPAVYTDGTHYTLEPDYTSSIRLGNFCGGGEGEALTYEMYVTPQNALVTIWYAMSLQNGQHSAAENPEFAILVEKQTGTGSTATWTHVGGDTLCYVQPSPLGTSYGAVSASDLSQRGGYNFYFGSTGTHNCTSSGGVNVYLPWHKVIIDLYKYLYQTIRLKMSAGDCCMSAHYACAYIAGDCQPMALTANGCAAGSTEQVAEVRAPKGLMSYQWYRSKTGVLNGPALNSDTSYVAIAGATDSILQVGASHFVNTYTGVSMPQITIKCQMQSLMNLNDSTCIITSKLYTTVGSMKPTLNVDTNMDCDGNVEITDLSAVAFDNGLDENKVDTSATIWTFYETPTPTGTPALVDTGGVASYTFTTTGEHCVTVRTSSFKMENGERPCWNEKTIPIRVRNRIHPEVDIERDSICFGDSIWLRDLSVGATYHEWHIFDSVGILDTTIVVEDTNVLEFTFWRTTTVELRTHGNTAYRADTNGSGNLVTLYCDSVTYVVIHAQDYPVFTLEGDTVVCIGSDAVIQVNTDATDCNFDWYLAKGEGAAFTSGRTMRHAPQADTRYFVKVTNQNGCEAWDSLDIHVVNPRLEVPVTDICQGHSATLSASRASTFSWTANPPDASLAGQESNAEITVSPQVTTTYSMVGHGTNGCSTPALTETIKVYPYPVMAFEMSPTFVDSEDPEIAFRDVSQYGVAARWDFGSGEVQTGREIVHTFTNLTQDSLPVTLTSYNALQCYSDTTFYVPVSMFSIWFPNAFTPARPINNRFRAHTRNILEYYSMYIFNRNGELVFYSTNQDEEWDGKYRGKFCDEGVYVYKCTYRRPNTVDIVTRTGNLLLVR